MSGSQISKFVDDMAAFIVGIPLLVIGILIFGFVAWVGLKLFAVILRLVLTF